MEISNLDEMNQSAVFLTGQLKSGDLTLLNEDLGAGGTTLIQFIREALGIRRTINSPTFNIIESYRGKNLKLHHMGCYHLEGSDEDLGFDESSEDQTITVIEWNQSVEDLLPATHLFINILTISGNSKQIELFAQREHCKQIKGAIIHEFAAH